MKQLTRRSDNIEIQGLYDWLEAKKYFDDMERNRMIWEQDEAYWDVAGNGYRLEQDRNNLFKKYYDMDINKPLVDWPPNTILRFENEEKKEPTIFEIIDWQNKADEMARQLMFTDVGYPPEKLRK